MKVLVVGAAGRLGASIVQTFSDCTVIAHTRATLDIADSAAVLHVALDTRPDVIINCAAYNRVDQAEDNPRDAFAVNAFAVRTMARAADEVGAVLVHYGTDFVFDGEAVEPYVETSEPSPRSTYGLSKLLGEWFALEAARGFVIRVESLFGSARGWSGRGGSLDAIVDALEQSRPARVFTDRIVSPSYVDDVARATRHLLDSGAPTGLYHCVNSGRATWWEVAHEAARLLGVVPRLDPMTVDSAQLRAPRPRFCALANEKLAAAGFAMPSWNDALRRWLAVRAAVRQGTIGEVHG